MKISRLIKLLKCCNQDAELNMIEERRNDFGRVIEDISESEGNYITIDYFMEKVNRGDMTVVLGYWSEVKKA